MSTLNKGYSPHSVFYYWKTILICGLVKAVQLYLWVYELSEGGPVLSILFEQSPRLLFVTFGLLFHKYPGNGMCVHSHLLTRVLLSYGCCNYAGRVYFSLLWFAEHGFLYDSFLLFTSYSKGFCQFIGQWNCTCF